MIRAMPQVPAWRWPEWLPRPGCATLLAGAAVALLLTSCSGPAPLRTRLHIVRTGDPAAPFALDRHDRLCVSKTKPPNADCPLSRWGYKPAAALPQDVTP